MSLYRSNRLLLCVGLSRFGTHGNIGVDVCEEQNQARLILPLPRDPQCAASGVNSLKYKTTSVVLYEQMALLDM
jgi:hypothetical protein